MKLLDSMGWNNPHNNIQTSLSVLLDSKLDMKRNKILWHGRGQNHNTETQKHIEVTSSGKGGLLYLRTYLVRHHLSSAGVPVYCKAPEQLESQRTLNLLKGRGESLCSSTACSTGESMLITATTWNSISVISHRRPSKQ